MKTKKPTIPKGWRVLRRGEILRDGDKGYFPANACRTKASFELTCYPGDPVGKPWLDAMPYITRRTLPRKAKKARK